MLTAEASVRNTRSNAALVTMGNINRVSFVREIHAAYKVCRRNPGCRAFCRDTSAQTSCPHSRRPTIRVMRWASAPFCRSVMASLRLFARLASEPLMPYITAAAAGILIQSPPPPEIGLAADINGTVDRVRVIRRGLCSAED